MQKKNYVIVIAGTAGSGKTVLSARVSELLGKAPILAFDEYFNFLEGWPEDIREWLDKGANTKQFRNIQMTSDIEALKQGKSIIHPITKETLQSSGYIIVEDPTGKERKDLAGLVDYLVYIDVPLEIALLRILQRFFDSEIELKDGSIAKFKEEAPERLLNRIEKFLKDYNDYYHDLYKVICDRVKEQADFVVDGLLSVDNLATIIVEEITKIDLED